LRIKITALTESPADIPFNYNYALHSAIYGLIEKSSGEYSRYLHDKGFINKTIKKQFILFTFFYAVLSIFGWSVFWIKAMPVNVSNNNGIMGIHIYRSHHE